MKSFKMFSERQDNPRRLNPWSAALPITFDLICGILLILLRQMALRVTSYALAGLMLIGGVWLIVSYFRQTPMEKITQCFLSLGLALTVSGVLLAFHPDYLKDFLPFIWGLAMLFGAFMKLQYAFDEKALGINRWWILLILSGFSLVIGILSLTNPAFLSESRELVIGIMLIAEAVLDFVLYLLISQALKHLFPEPRAELPLKTAGGKTEGSTSENRMENPQAAANPPAAGTAPVAANAPESSGPDANT